MRQDQDIDYTQYDPADFVRDHPNDARLQRALHEAQELAAHMPPTQPDESPLDARRRMEQGFDELITKIDNELYHFHEGERVTTQAQFVRQGEAQINANRQRGIEATPHLALKVGGQIARQDELQYFKQNLANNPDLKAEMEQLVHKQAARAEAISHIIGKLRDDHIREQGLDRADDEEEVKTEKARHEEVQQAEALPKQGMNENERKDYEKPLPWESEEQARASAAKAMTIIENRTPPRDEGQNWDIKR